MRAKMQGGWSLWGALTTLLVVVGTVTAVLGAKAVARSDADKARLGFHRELAQGFLMGRPDTAEIVEQMLGLRPRRPDGGISGSVSHAV
jgi:hypothetical protein